MASSTKTERVRQNIRRVMLAGLGAAALAQESARDLGKRLLAKGEKTEPKIKRKLKELSERRRKAAKKAAGVAAKARGWTQKLPIVTKSDVAALAKRIDTLTEKVDALSKKPKKRSR